MADRTPQEKRKATLAKNKKLKEQAGDLFQAETKKRVKAEAELRAYKNLIKDGWAPKGT